MRQDFQNSRPLGSIYLPGLSVPGGQPVYPNHRKVAYTDPKIQTDTKSRMAPQKTTIELVAEAKYPVLKISKHQERNGGWWNFIQTKTEGLEAVSSRGADNALRFRAPVTSGLIFNRHLGNNEPVYASGRTKESGPMFLEPSWHGAYGMGGQQGGEVRTGGPKHRLGEDHLVQSPKIFHNDQYTIDTRCFKLAPILT